MKTIFMKSSLIILITGGLNFIASQAYGHEGHAHGPQIMRPIFGGVIHEGKTLALELVQEAQAIKLYPLIHDKDKPWKAASLADAKIKSARIQLPRESKAQEVVFQKSADHFSAKIDAKGAHRYDLIVQFSIKDKEDEVRILIEPQS